MKKFIFLLLFTVSTHVITGQSLLQNLYCTILGTVDIKAEYKAEVHEALRAYGIKNPEDIPVKQMNAVGPLVAITPLSSFTAFGIWFDQNYLDACCPEERTFKFYHEAAHYAQHHHQKLLVTEAIITVLSSVGLCMVNDILKRTKCSNQISSMLAASLITATAVYLGITPYFVKQQEKEADIVACKKLQSLDKQHIVKAHSDSLAAKSSGSTLWWFSDKQQSDYLQAAV